MKKSDEQYLNKVWRDPKYPASYAGLDKLYKQVKKDGKNIKKKDIREWLQSQETHTVYKKLRKNSLESVNILVRIRNILAEGSTMDIEK